MFPLADWLRSKAVELSSAAVESVLVEDFDVGRVIHTDAGTHTLSPQTSAAEGWGLLQSHEAVAAETALELVRCCHFIQDLGEPWDAEKQKRADWDLMEHRVLHLIFFQCQIQLRASFCCSEGRWPDFRSSQLLHTEPSHRMGRPRSPLSRGCHNRRTKT